MKEPWSPTAYTHIQTRLGNIQTLAHIIEHTTTDPPEINENQIETLKQIEGMGKYSDGTSRSTTGRSPRKGACKSSSKNRNTK